MAREELDELEPKVAPLEEEIKILLIPADPEDSKNCTMEIRGGTGGDEAAIFAGEGMNCVVNAAMVGNITACHTAVGSVHHSITFQSSNIYFL